MDFFDAWFDEAKAFAVGGAVEDAGVGAAFGKLLAGAGDGVLAGSIEFVFPANDAGGGESGAECGKDFFGGPEFEVEDFGAAGELVARLGAVDLGDLEIAEGGGLENGVRFGGEVLEGLGEGFVGGE